MIETARRQLESQGWAVLPDPDASFRTQVTKGFPGQYVSYWDPELRRIVIALHSRIREALGI